MDRDDEPDPLLEYEGEPEELDDIASNDEWAFREADRLVSRIPGREGTDRRTEGEVFDRHSLLTLHKLLVGGVLRSLDFPVSTGKEANVFRGTTPQGALVAVKIYRVNTATFKRVLPYIQGDERFEGVSRDKRELVNAWSQKEFRNLRRMHDAGTSVPEPIRFLHNVLVMEYIGVPEGPWPRLRDIGRLPDPRPFFESIRDDYHSFIEKAELVHADLSEFNVLVEGAGTDAARPRIIDVGQAVLLSHPMSREFLERDVRNITNYFRRQRLDVGPADFLGDIRSEVSP